MNNSIMNQTVVSDTKQGGLNIITSSTYLFEQLTKLLKEREVKMFGEVKKSFNQLFNEESKQIWESLKRYEEKRKIQFEEYIYALPQRLEDLKRMLEEIENHPFKSITNKVKEMCRKNKMCPELITSLIKKVKNTVINTVIKEAIAFETTQWNVFYETEIKKINVNYYVQNDALKILSPNQYQKHLDLVLKTMRAYHQDMKSFLTTSADHFTPVWNFFDYMIQHIKSLQDMQLNMSA